MFGLGLSQNGLFFIGFPLFDNPDRKSKRIAGTLVRLVELMEDFKSDGGEAPLLEGGEAEVALLVGKVDPLPRPVAMIQVGLLVWAISDEPAVGLQGFCPFLDNGLTSSHQKSSSRWLE